MVPTEIPTENHFPFKVLDLKVLTNVQICDKIVIKRQMIKTDDLTLWHCSAFEILFEIYKNPKVRLQRV